MHTGSSPGPQVNSTDIMSLSNYSTVTVSIDVHQDESNCITCTFLANSTSSSCVVIISEKAQLSDPVYGLLSIMTYRFNRTDDVAYGCLPETVNLEDHTIAVFAFDNGRIIFPPADLEIMQLQSSSSTTDSN